MDAKKFKSPFHFNLDAIGNGFGSSGVWEPHSVAKMMIQKYARRFDGGYDELGKYLFMLLSATEAPVYCVNKTLSAGTRRWNEWKNLLIKTQSESYSFLGLFFVVVVELVNESHKQHKYT